MLFLPLEKRKKEKNLYNITNIIKSKIKTVVIFKVGFRERDIMKRENMVNKFFVKIFIINFLFIIDSINMEMFIFRFYIIKIIINHKI